MRGFVDFRRLRPPKGLGCIKVDPLCQRIFATRGRAAWLGECLGVGEMGCHPQSYSVVDVGNHSSSNLFRG